MNRRFPYRLVSAIAIFLLQASGSSAMELRYSGNTRSMLYGWENPLVTGTDQENNYRFFQYLRLKLKGVGKESSVSFNTYLRVTDDLSVDYASDPNWRLYNGYLQWDTRLTSISIGRQWLHYGPASATLDGAQITIGDKNRTSLTGYLGAETPFTRKFDANGMGKAGSGGLYFSTHAVSNLTLGAGFYQKNRYGETAFREVGVNARASLPHDLDLYSRLDVNLLTDQLQKGQIRLRYKGSDRVQFFGEYKLYRPRLFYKSYYQRFELEGNNQLRGGLSVFFRPEVTLNASYSAVMAEEDNSGFFTLGASCPFGWVNYYKGVGYGGDQDGFAVGGSLPLAKDRVEIFADIDYSRFRFYEDEDRDYLFSSIFGLHWRPIEQLEAGVEFQDVNNDVFSKDFRVLLKFAWNFSSAFGARD
ncbi:MAG: hypothetical protein V1794_13110 [Candidatus Glassbacteria bacterium]